MVFCKWNLSSLRSLRNVPAGNRAHCGFALRTLRKNSITTEYLLNVHLMLLPLKLFLPQLGFCYSL
jgi:hypothetical protein